MGKHGPRTVGDAAGRLDRRELVQLQRDHLDRDGHIDAHAVQGADESDQIEVTLTWHDPVTGAIGVVVRILPGEHTVVELHIDDSLAGHTRQLIEVVRATEVVPRVDA